MKPAFTSPEDAGLDPLSFVNIDVFPGGQAGTGGGTREVGWDSIGFDPGTGHAEFAYIRSDGTVVKTYTMEPLNEVGYPSIEPA